MSLRVADGGATAAWVSIGFTMKSMSATVARDSGSDCRSHVGPRAGPGVTAPSKMPGGGAAGFLSNGSLQSSDESDRPASRHRPPPPAPAKCHILLIEDGPTTSNALRVLLTMHGCDVTVARSLERGLDLLHTNPTAIVVDLMLPDGDGIEILTRVREANLPIKVVVTTAVGDPARLAAVHRLKPECVLRKPIDLGELLRAIGLA